MLGETANLRTANIPYFQILIIPEKVPYFDKGGIIKNWEDITVGDKLKKYEILDKDNINLFYHSPLLTLVMLVSLKLKRIPLDKLNFKSKKDLKKKILQEKNNFEITISNKVKPERFGRNVILNDYESFLYRVINYLKFCGL